MSPSLSGSSELKKNPGSESVPTPALLPAGIFLPDGIFPVSTANVPRVKQLPEQGKGSSVGNSDMEHKASYGEAGSGKRGAEGAALITLLPFVNSLLVWGAGVSFAGVFAAARGH